MSPNPLGRGLDLPMVADARGRLPVADGPEAVRRSLRVILETEPGERLMRPGFGCGLRRHLMKPNTVATRALIQRDVERALERWEPRVQLQQVSVDPGDDPSLVWIRVDYALRRDRSPESLVYPFYLE